jgi:hypothetical protein
MLGIDVAPAKAELSPGSLTQSACKASWTWPRESLTAGRQPLPLGYADATAVRVFQGTVDGTLATEPRGTSGFGYDPRLHPRRRHRPPHLGGDD